MKTFKSKLKLVTLALASVLTQGLCAVSEAGAAPNADKLPINIGRSLPLSGPLTPYGEAKRDGADAYLNKINKEGGLGGRKLVLTTLDDAYEPAKITENLRKMAKDSKLSAFLGLFGVPSVAAAIPVIEELKIPTVGLTSGSSAIRTPFKRYLFPIRASFADEAAFTVNHLKTLSHSRVVIIHQDNDFGKLVRDTFISEFNIANIKVVADVTLPVGVDNADAVVAQVLSSKPDTIILSMLSTGAVPTMAAFAAKGLVGIPLYAISAVDGSLMTTKLGKAAAGLGISQIVPIPEGFRTKIGREYTDALIELGRGTPSFYGLEAFVEAKVLVAGLKAAGKNVDNPESVVKGLESLGDYNVGDFPVSYNATEHRGSKFVELTVITSRGTLIR